MEAIIQEFALQVARAVEFVAVLIIAYGALPWPRRHCRVFRGFARWLILALEFTLAGDIVRTAMSPTWDDIGQLAAIAIIRTFLNFFLERDLDKAGEQGREPEAEAPLRAGRL